MFAVAQLGARMHYAVPRIFAAAGMLETFYTDMYATPFIRSLGRLAPENCRPAALRRWLARAPEQVAPARIKSFPAFGLKYRWRQTHATTVEAETAVHIWAGREFCRKIIRGGLGAARAVYTFNSAGLELMKHARHRGLCAVMEQTIAPSEIEHALLEAEQESFPGWESPRIRNSRAIEFQERDRLEWDNASLILCGSEFVREGIRACGGPVGRCSIVPYGIQPCGVGSARPFTRGPLRVLTAGSVTLRKGAPYVLLAAKGLKSLAEFRIAGPICVTPYARDLLSAHVHLVGAIPRDEIRKQYEWADVFLLPSICEGSATVCYEALAFGLPVITTPNAGSVVRDGVDGFIVPIRDAQAVVQKLDLLARDREMLAWMSANATARSRDFTLEKYGDRLLAALGGFWRPEDGTRD
ncbi:MAG: glycosyltransferase family 4 protein [Bryobacteraceae bacterium]|jgi:glycosyltransferase involved in cell wall biosynthesis